MAIAIALMTLFIVSPGFRWFFLNVMLNLLINSCGPRGGGGSSGGGGASGSW